MVLIQVMNSEKPSETCLEFGFSCCSAIGFNMEPDFSRAILFASSLKVHKVAGGLVQPQLAWLLNSVSISMKVSYCVCL